MGRGSANVEDQLRSAIAALEGLRIVDPTAAQAVRNDINKAIEEFLRSLLATERGLADVLEHLRRHHSGHAPVLPVFAMYDARRKLHQAAHAQHPDWPVVPMASLIEQTAVLRRPIGDLAPRAPAAEAIARLWRGIEQKLTSPQA